MQLLMHFASYLRQETAKSAITAFKSKYHLDGTCLITQKWHPLFALLKDTSELINVERSG